VQLPFYRWRDGAAKLDRRQGRLKELGGQAAHGQAPETLAKLSDQNFYIDEK